MSALLKGQVEIIAPAEYMVRAPQAPAFLFVIDVSHYAVQSGMVAAAAEAIKASLDAMPGGEGGRTKIGFITFSSSVQFYNLKAGLSQPQMLNMADIEEPFLPMADELLVPLSDSRQLVELLLDALPTMFTGTTDIDTATGAAMECAYKAMKVSVLLFTVTFHANHAHNLTRSP
jgi:protein transport protein SEC24